VGAAGGTAAFCTNPNRTSSGNNFRENI
jgi:hypothetical protein